MLHSLIALKPRDVPIRVALRNTFAVVAPLAIGVATDHTAAGLAMATGAINTMFGDQPGPYRLRMQRMLLAAMATGVSALLGILIGAHTAWLVVAAFAIGLGGGMLVALGPVATRVGLTSMILLIISADMRLPPQHAPAVAGLIFAGGLLQMLMAVAAWPLQRYRPERFALAILLRQLADIARQRPGAALPPPATQAVQDAILLLHGEHRARGIAVQSFRIIAELCERTRLELLSLSDLHARIGNAAAHASIEAVLAQSAMVLDCLGHTLETTEKPVLAEAAMHDFQQRIDALAQARAGMEDVRDRRLLRIAATRAQSLAGQLRSLIRNSRWASSRGEVRAELAEARLPAALRPRAPLATLRANLSLSSVAFRHAIRCAVCLAAAIAFERTLAIPHGVWIPMTTAIVLKPDFGGTLSFGALRVAGTFAGLLLTTALAHFAMDGVLLRLLLLGLLCMGFRLLTQVNYGLGVAFLTGMLVMLLSFEGVAPGDAIVARLSATVLGSLLALTAYAAWPTWEGKRIKTSMAELIEAYRLHLRAVLGGQMDDLVETRSSARSARTNMQASIERLRGEPRRKRRNDELWLAESLLANGNRLIRATLSLEAVLRDGTQLPELPELKEFTMQCEHALTALAQASREERPPPSLALRPVERRLAEALGRQEGSDSDPATIALADTCDRITDSINTLAHLLRGKEPVLQSTGDSTPTRASG